MEFIAIRWQGKADRLFKIVRLKGSIDAVQDARIISPMLIYVALEVLSIAEKFEGRILPLNEPPKEKGNFVYFEVIFRENKDFFKFLEAMGIESSQWGLDIFIVEYIEITSWLIYNQVKEWFYDRRNKNKLS